MQYECLLFISTFSLDNRKKRNMNEVLWYRTDSLHLLKSKLFLSSLNNHSIFTVTLEENLITYLIYKEFHLKILDHWVLLTAYVAKQNVLTLQYGKCCGQKGASAVYTCVLKCVFLSLPCSLAVHNSKCLQSIGSLLYYYLFQIITLKRKWDSFSAPHPRDRFSMTE